MMDIRYNDDGARVGDDRDEVLTAYQILDTGPEQAFDEVAALAAAICGTPIAAVTLIDRDRQWFKARVGFDHHETPLDRSLCAIVAGKTDPQMVEFRDTSTDPRLQDRRDSLTLDVGFYAGMPLISREGVSIGVLCVADPQPRPGGLTIVQRKTLQTLARQITAQLELRRTVLERDRHAAEREKTHAEAEWLATHDPLTGLGNRALFQQAIDAVAAGPDGPTALVVLDLDHFKDVNDFHGHDAGDALLRVVAARLTEVVTVDDATIVRLGGDELGVLLPGIGRDERLDGIIAAILDGVQGPFAYRGRQIDVGITIGAAVYPDNAGDAADLIRHADVALYAGKAAGRGRAVLFEQSMLDATHARAAMLDRARRALSDKSVVPFYQEKVELRTGRLCGFEALLRIRRPDGRFDLPATIAAALEEGGLADRLGRVMLTQVAADMRAWLDAGLEFGRVSVNASACEIGDPDYAARVLDTLARAGVPASCLEVEVTESVLLDRNVATVEQTLHALVDAGVRIALDDFGTGYASLIHLARFPVDVLKIDRSFMAGLRDGSQRQVIVKAILQLARGLGIDTVAEGVETAMQAGVLRANGCGTGQGFLFGAALPEKQARLLLSGMTGAAPGERGGGDVAFAVAA